MSARTKPSEISSLTQLRERRKVIRLEMEYTKRGFAHSMGVMRSDLKKALLTRVALPVGAAGALFLGWKLWQRKSHAHDEPQPPAKRGGTMGKIGKWVRYLPMLQTVVAYVAGHINKQKSSKERVEQA